MCKMLRPGFIAGSFALVLAMTGSAFSQITVSSSDILGLIGQVQQMVDVDTSTTAKTVDVGTSGAMQNWNFDNFSLNDTLMFDGSFIPPAGTPFAANNPDANLVQFLAGETDNPLGSGTVPLEIYNYFEVTDTGLRALGTGSVVRIPIIGNITALETISFTSTAAPLPATFGLSWKATSSDSNRALDSSLSLTITKSSSSDSSVIDAWGTARVGGEDVEALRICSFDTTIIQEVDDNNNNIGSPDTVITIEYSFATTNNGFIAQITSLPGETNPDFTQGTMIVLVRGGVITAIGDEPGDGILPTTFDLFQNYPNPFNPETQIRYSVGETGHVELAVFDMNGREVKTLLSQDMPPGNFTISWDGTDNIGAKVASGRYIYNIRLNGEAKSKIMVLVK